MSFVLAIDIGTSGVRGALFNLEGSLVSESFVSKKWQIESDGEGRASLDARYALSKVEETIDEVLARAWGEEILLAGISSFWHSLMGVDEQGQPATDLILWADTRSRSFVNVLRESLNEKDFHKLTGARFHSSYWSAKLLWLRNKFPEEFRRTAKWVSFADYVASEFFGQFVTSVSMASGTGLFDIQKLRWSEEIVNFCGLKLENLSEIVDSRISFRLKDEKHRRWDKLAQTDWFLSIGDGAANNIGLGCTTKNRAALMIGSSGAMRVIADDLPSLPAGLWCYRVDEARSIFGGALSDGGLLYDWLRRNLRCGELESFEPNAHGLVFLPFLAGERSTGYNPNAKGAILGLTISATASEILQAALESVAYRFASIFDELKKTVEITEIICSGKVLRKSAVWLQIISDVLGRDVYFSELEEASLLGAAIFAIEKAGYKLRERDLPSKRVVFDERRHQIYRTARKRHEALYRKIICENSI